MCHLPRGGRLLGALINSLAAFGVEKRRGVRCEGCFYSFAVFEFYLSFAAVYGMYCDDACTGKYRFLRIGISVCARLTDENCGLYHS